MDGLSGWVGGWMGVGLMLFSTQFPTNNVHCMVYLFSSLSLT